MVVLVAETNMGQKLAGKDLDVIINRFCSIDRDGDGKITNSELHKYLAEHKYSEEETDYMMRKTNLVNRKQTVEFHEFFFMMAPIRPRKMRLG